MATHKELKLLITWLDTFVTALVAQGAVTRMPNMNGGYVYIDVETGEVSGKWSPKDHKHDAGMVKVVDDDGCEQVVVYLLHLEWVAQKPSVTTDCKLLILRGRNSRVRFAQKQVYLGH